MLTPKEALAKDGKIPVKEGRGRLSRAAIDRVNELVADGWDIKGYTRSKSTTKTEGAPEPKVTKVSGETSGKTIAELPPMRYDETVWVARSEVPIHGKTEFGMREVCTNCSNSLSYHYCDSPAILGGVPVTIVTK